MHQQNQNNKMLDIFKKCVEQIKTDRSKLTCDPMTETAKRAAARVASAAEKMERQRRLNQRRSHTQFFGSQNPPFNQNDVHFPEYLDDSSITKQAEIKAHDKRAIVSHFLHNDSVFTHLCKVMFGAEDGEDSNDTFVQQRNDIT